MNSSVTQRSPVYSFSSSLRFTRPLFLHTPSWTTHQNWWTLWADLPSPVSCSALATTLDKFIISLFCFHLCCLPIKYCEIQSSIPRYQDQFWHKEPINNTRYWSFCFISILSYNYSISFLEKKNDKQICFPNQERQVTAPHTMPPPQAPAALPVKATLRAFALSTSFSASLQPASFWALHPSLRLEGSRK